MFKEDIESIDAANKASNIKTGWYEADVTAVRTIAPKTEAQSAQLVVSFTIVDGDYEGLDYPMFVSLSGKAAGPRSAFYRGIGYVTPPNGEVDENDFLGLSAKVNVVNDGAQQSIRKVLPSERKQDDSDDKTDGSTNDPAEF